MGIKASVILPSLNVVDYIEKAVQKEERKSMRGPGPSFLAFPVRSQMVVFLLWK